jgi:hypothetical protein
MPLDRTPTRRTALATAGAVAATALTGLHAFTAGSEAGNVAIQVSALIMATLLVFLVVYRLLAPRKPNRRAVEGAGTG